MEIKMLNLQHKSARGLKNALRANAIFSVLSGLFIVFGHDLVLQWLGLSDINIMVIGVGLVFFAVYLIWMAVQKGIPRSMVSGVIAGDWAWVVGSVVLVVLKSGIFSTFGLFLVLDAALVVMIFAIWQQRGLVRITTVA